MSSNVKKIVNNIMKQSSDLFLLEDEDDSFASVLEELESYLATVGQTVSSVALTLDRVGAENRQSMKHWLNSMHRLKLEQPREDLETLREIASSGKIDRPVVMDLVMNRIVLGETEMLAALLFDLDFPFITIEY